MSKYTYNGIELEQIPASTSPVAVISSVLESASSMFGGASYIVTFGASILWSGGKCYVSNISGVYRYNGSAWVWHYGSGTTYTQDIIASGYFEAVWTNTNIPTEDGVSVYLAASEPVEVGGESGGGSEGEEEEDTTTPEYTIDDVNEARRRGFIAGFLTGVNIRGVLNKKTITEPTPATYYLYGTPSDSGNVAIAEGDGYTLYEGAVLPTIDTVYTEELKETHPYVYIATGLNGAKTYAIFSEETISVSEGGELLGGQFNCITYLENDGSWVKTTNSLFYVVVWSNTDVYYYCPDDESINGTLYLAASNPIPLASNEPVAAVYGGVKLPVIDTVYTEELKETHPYALIGTSSYGYMLVASVNNLPVNASESVLTTPTGQKRYNYTDGEWVKLVSTNTRYVRPVWASTDLYYSDSVDNVGGTLYFAKSDPIPVYEQKE